ncbi:Nramp family divalent metal transporter [uncultured Arthrobacter sp.]|uniref:Nramp family divalent metal transporter n=1 Tax=uncultured Arthrobacter sp. TaxID=114050 RepID=UPI0026214127|nr:Nramp family divalent metal transporter [uncultured Arthrobacter sp.]
MPKPFLRGRERRAFPLRGVLLLGPAFVASVAYVDPGNVAANLTAGARYGYLLVWVLVAANLMAVLIQYQSAKLGLVTGRSLPELIGGRLPAGRRRAFWVQAEVVAAATDVAEVIGGALALNLLFGTPLVLGGIIMGAASMLLLALQSRNRQHLFERTVLVLLAVIAAGFTAGFVANPPAPGLAVAGLVPRLEGADTVLLAASMLGATVMPHAIYLHSALSVHRHGAGHAPSHLRRLIRAARVDVVAALALAGTVNIAMLLAAASSLRGVDGTDSIEGAYAAIGQNLGPIVAAAFAVGLLASGLASTSVGCYAGAVIMEGLLRVRVSLWVRRAVTLLPALVILGGGVEPTMALVISQVVLSMGIPFALVPLVGASADRRLMGEHVNSRALSFCTYVSAGLIIALNVALLVLTFTGAG